MNKIITSIKNSYNILIINVLVLFILLFILEIGFRYFAPLPDPYALDRTFNRYISSEFPCNYHFFTEPESGLPGVSGLKSFCTNNKGFRGDSLKIPKPSQEFRIFMIGGSTTECFYLDDKEAITYVLQKQLTELLPNNLSVKVYNAGKSGDATPDHIAMLANRITHLQPDMIVLFSGFNDLHHAMVNYDYTHYQSGKVITDKIRLYLSHFQLFRRIHSVASLLKNDRKQVLQSITFKSQVQQLAKLDREFPQVSTAPITNLNAYYCNLKTITGIAQANEIQLVMMTQQTTWNSSIDTQIQNWHWLRKGYQQDLLSAAMDSLNVQMRLCATKFQVPLYDLANDIPKSREYFYDDCHFNTKGAEYAGKNLAKYVAQDLLKHK